MALFGKKKENENKVVEEATKDEVATTDASTTVATKDTKSAAGEGGVLNDVAVKGERFNALRRPRITEKATDLSEENVYTFEVDKNASKSEIRKAVKDFYNVDPIDVRTVRIPHKYVGMRGRRGVKPGGKKAYVKLKKGDRIELI